MRQRQGIMAKRTILIKWKWIFLAAGILIVFFSFEKYCRDAGYEKKIRDLDKEISDLEEENVKLEGEVVEYVKGAIADEAEVAKLEAEIEESKSRIKYLEKEEEVVEEIVMALPPLELVEETREILGCAEILLNEEGILFSVECAREGLLKLKRFSLVEKKYDEAIFALSKSGKALTFQKRVSWRLFGALWKMGDQIINYKVIAKKQAIKFNLAEKQNKKRFLSGLWKGFVIGIVVGAVVTTTFKFVIRR